MASETPYRYELYTLLNFNISKSFGDRQCMVLYLYISGLSLCKDDMKLPGCHAGGPQSSHGVRAAERG